MEEIAEEYKDERVMEQKEKVGEENEKHEK